MVDVPEENGQKINHDFGTIVPVYRTRSGSFVGLQPSTVLHCVYLPRDLSSKYIVIVVVRDIRVKAVVLISLPLRRGSKCSPY